MLIYCPLALIFQHAHVQFNKLTSYPLPLGNEMRKLLDRAPALVNHDAQCRFQNQKF